MAIARIRLLCVDDHRVVREGIVAMIGRRPDMEVVAAAGNGEEAIELFLLHRVECINSGRVSIDRRKDN
jgi:DNA-binding NarL/FixJ family response regulator